MEDDPAASADCPPTLRVHEGHEWSYVLTGRMRLLLDKQELLLGIGDAIEFDTGLPNWFGSDDDRPAEILSLFGRPGERMQHVQPVPHRRPLVP